MMCLRTITRGSFLIVQSWSCGLVTLIAAGYLADMVVLERDPAADIANMRSVLMVVKRGHRLARADYHPTDIEGLEDD